MDMSKVSKSDVAQLQRALRENVAPSLNPDGVWGNASVAAFAQFAQTTGTDEAGAMALLHKYADLRYVNDDAYAQAAKALGVPQSYVRAIQQVETTGSSFLPDGRVKILFERQWFYQKLKGAIASNAATRANVAAKLKSTATDVATLMTQMVQQFGDICNPVRGGYQGGAAEWDRLNKAMDFDVESGAQAASYGGYQLMGFNYKGCGYSSGKAMMLALAASESCQFLAMISFIKSNPNLWSSFKAANWAAFAEGYNGSQYKQNNYDTKLASAEQSSRSYNVA
ncbi:hypothetical protein [Ralstonia phage RP31]|uniref:N-acetylmuramidase domain-containing protein n=2 Tax=Ripduovirus RP12 TaxID=2560700 RepID=A0A1L7N177_9CAUD|nr:endolysin [Ralstonia phage RP12]BAW19239.1 hypothetical protein [Ralstonia phage RP12]BAW19525.1 hypothetical protein [Ralstonia phage RP31]